MIVEEADNRGDSSMALSSDQDSMSKISLSSMMGETMRRKVNKKIKEVNDNKLKIYKTIQLTTELEAIKKQELNLLTKVEIQRYTQSMLKKSLDEMKEQFESSSDYVRGEIRKLQDKFESLKVQSSGENFAQEMYDVLQKLRQNLDLYKEIVRDPNAYISILPAGTTDKRKMTDLDRERAIYKKGLKQRHKTPEEIE